MQNKSITTKWKINMRNKPFFRSFLSKFFFLFLSIDCSIWRNIYLSRLLKNHRTVVSVDQAESWMEEEVLENAYSTIEIEIQLLHVVVYVKELSVNDWNRFVLIDYDY